MKKIPSVFKRDYEGTRLVFDEVVPGSEWVLAGEGTPTVKYDGTACLVRGDGTLCKRHDRKRKHGKTKPAPPGWEPCEPEPNEHTGHWPGWVPVGDGPEGRWHREALDLWVEAGGLSPNPGTYELVGPKVQGNPHGYERHRLIPHGENPILADELASFDAIRDYLASVPEIEGIVWHHPDGRMAKIKRRDFGLSWPPERSETP